MKLSPQSDNYCAVQHTVISLFLSWKYFRMALVVRKFVTRILFHYENFSPSKHFLIWIFRTGARTRGVNSGTRWEGELKSAAVNNCKCESRMSLRQYFKLLLPDPRGSLSEALPSAAIASANREIQKVLNAKKVTKKKGPYSQEVGCKLTGIVPSIY